MRDLLETACGVEARGEFVGERLIVDKAVRVRRADRLLVKVLGVECAAFYACDFRANQRCTVFVILRAMLGPYFELRVVSCQSLEMLLSQVGRWGIPGCRVTKGTIEVILRHFKICWRCPQQSLRFQ